MPSCLQSLAKPNTVRSNQPSHPLKSLFQRKLPLPPGTSTEPAPFTLQQVCRDPELEKDRCPPTQINSHSEDKGCRDLPRELGPIHQTQLFPIQHTHTLKLSGFPTTQRTLWPANSHTTYCLPFKPPFTESGTCHGLY